eukprot:tig00000388_g24810.t1
MDLEAFSDASFDVLRWVNDALKRGRAPEENLDTHVATLVQKLQFLSGDLNRSLEEIGTKSMHSLTRTMRELERLRNEAMGLKSTTLNISANLTQIEQETSGCVAAIASVDTIKHKMDNCLSVLGDADNVAKLAKEMDRVFATGDLSSIAETLGAMQRSVKALQGVPEFEQYQRRAGEMQEKLEALVSQKLVDALESRNQDGARMYKEVLEKVGRGALIGDLYVAARQKAIAASWGAWSGVQAGERAHQQLARWLASFYDQTLAFVNGEAAWCASVFPESRHFLPQLLVHALQAIARSTPSASTRPAPAPAPPRPAEPAQALRAMAGAGAADAPSALEALIDLHGLAAGFAGSCREILVGAGAEAGQANGAVAAAMRPFASYQRDYRSLEAEHLSRALADLAQEGDTVAECVRSFEESVGRLLNHLQHAPERCVELTGGAEAEQMIEGINDVLASYAQRLTGIVRAVRRICRLGGPDKAPEEKKAGGQPGALRPGGGPQAPGSQKGPAAPASAVAPASARGAPPASAALFQHDWSDFQGALQLQAAGRSLIVRLLALDAPFRAAIAAQARPRPRPAPPGAARRGLRGGAGAAGGAGGAGGAGVHGLRVRGDKERLARVKALFRRLDEGRLHVVGAAQGHLQALYTALRSLVYDAATHAVRLKLAPIPSLPVWASEPAPAPSGLMLPVFSLSPLEYVTQVGEHLLTLPQQLEPFAAAAAAGGAGHASLPLFEDFPSPAAPAPEGEEEDEEAAGAFAAGWIAAVAKGTAQMYVEQILQIPNLGATGSRQLATDIGYLSNVMSALGVAVEAPLRAAQRLLGASRDEFLDAVEDDPSIDRKLARTLAAIRSIPWKQ